MADCGFGECRTSIEAATATPRSLGVRVRGDTLYRARAVILTTGTFLKAIMHTGEAKTPAAGPATGPTGTLSATSLRRLRLRAARGSRPARRAGSTAGPSTSRKLRSAARRRLTRSRSRFLTDADHRSRRCAAT